MKFERQSPLYPKSFRPKRPGWGKRKRAREARKTPLLEQFLPTAEDYERGLIEAMERHYRRRRRIAARGWREIRQWRRSATHEELETFDAWWKIVPRTPAYGLEIIHGIRTGCYRRRGTKPEVAGADRLYAG